MCLEPVVVVPAVVVAIAVAVAVGVGATVVVVEPVVVHVDVVVDALMTRIWLDVDIWFCLPTRCMHSANTPLRHCSSSRRFGKFVCNRYVRS
jgi:hypothetical protein